MANQPPVVRPWVESTPLAPLGQEVRVFSVGTPQTTQRDTARQLVRQALRAILASHLGCPAAAVPLLSQPGLGLHLAGEKIGLSVSHEAGLSLIAINPAGAVGVDILKLATPTMPDDELLRLAREYLGKTTAQQIASLPPSQHWPAFAKAWTHLEARLKCRGQPLAEWFEQQQASPEHRPALSLQLPEGYVGALAIG